MHPPARMGARTYTIAIALAAAVTSHAQSARADGLSPNLAETSAPPPSLPASPSPSGPTHWYGGEILLVDLASDLAMIGGAAMNNADGGALALFGAIGYVAGAPIIHAYHHSGGGVVAASLAMRLGFPLLGFVIGFGAASCDSRPAPSSSDTYAYDLSGLACSNKYGALGFGIGMLTAQILDDAFLSTEPARSGDAASSAATPPLLVQPTVGTLRDRERRTVPTLGVVVSF